MHTVRVPLGLRTYDIVIASAMLGGLGERLRGFGFSRKVVIVSNPTVFRLYGDVVAGSLRRAGTDVSMVVIPDGEEFKDMERFSYILGELLKIGLDRKSALIALGGGVIGDITGFAASTYMRGIGYIQVPTTLLSQVDSSVGGKTGVNHPIGKNMIGTFYQPRLVWIDMDTLKTLSKRQFLSGMSEVIKYGIIWERGFFDFLKEGADKLCSLEAECLGYAIKMSCQIKAEVVSKDETEAGLRIILNLGHTVGHAIETVTGYTRYLHGETVAMGMYAEAKLAHRLSLIDEASVNEIREIIDTYGLPSHIPDDIDRDALIKAMAIDKKAVDGEVRFVLPTRIGHVESYADIDKRDILGALC